MRAIAQRLANGCSLGGTVILPTWVRIKGTVNNTGVFTVDPDNTTPGLSMVRASAGVYTLTFMPCRDSYAAFGRFSGNAAAAANKLRVHVDDPVVTTGTVTVRTISTADVDTDSTVNATLEVLLWLDLG